MVNILNAFQKNIFKNFSSRVNWIIVHFYGWFVQAYQTVLLTKQFDNDIAFNELLSINNEVSIHNKNIKTLLIELYKKLNRLSPPIM